MSEPPLCSLKELEDGTYSIEDVQLFNQMLAFKQAIAQAAKGD